MSVQAHPIDGTPWTVRIEELPRRRVAVRPHHGPVEAVDDARRPLYQYLIMHEAVGGPSMLRFVDDPASDRIVDVLVGTTEEYPGDDTVEVEVVPRGWYALLDFEGSVDQLPEARAALMSWAAQQGHRSRGDLLQVHLMDEIEGETEQQLQLPIGP